MPIDDLVQLADTMRKLDRLTEFVISEINDTKKALQTVQAHNIVLKQENSKLKKLLKIEQPYSPASQV